VAGRAPGQDSLKNGAPNIDRGMMIAGGKRLLAN
jgi:hypothetical protein